MYGCGWSIWAPVWGSKSFTKPAPNRPQTIPTGPRTTSNCSHMSCSHIHGPPVTAAREDRRPFIISVPKASIQGPGEGLYLLLRNSAFGQEIWLPARISAGFKLEKFQNRPSGRPKAGRRADFEAFPISIRPRTGPEARFPARKHYWIGVPWFPRGPGDMGSLVQRREFRRGDTYRCVRIIVARDRVNS